MSTTVRHRADEGRYYHNLAIHAAPGVHQEAFSVLRRLLVPGQRAIDLGAGSGAFTKRLVDSGLRVEAVDFDPSSWPLPAAPLHQRDLNASAWQLPAHAYDVVTAVEVLEHIENVSGFLRNVRELLRPGGLFFFTTPNVVSVESRRRMILKGELSFFGKGVLFEGGHLTVLPPWLLEDLLCKEEYTVVQRTFVGRQPILFRQGRSWWKRLCVPPIDLALLLLGRGIPYEAAFTSSVAVVATPSQGVS